MTLQQLEYIVAVDTHRHFVRAAEACGVTQSTLSAMIRKLETELDVQIFDRESHPVRPTAFGEQLLRQARVLLYNASQFGEMARAERSADTGVKCIKDFYMVFFYFSYFFKCCGNFSIAFCRSYKFKVFVFFYSI